MPTRAVTTTGTTIIIIFEILSRFLQSYPSLRVFLYYTSSDIVKQVVKQNLNCAEENPPRGYRERIFGVEIGV